MGVRHCCVAGARPGRGALAATAAARTAQAKAPIVIGWAFDSKGAMAPFDDPALAAAQLRVKQVNAKGGVNGRKLQIKTCDTQGNKPAIAKACALRLLGQGANVIFTTCDVDYAAPVVQAAINRGVLAIAPCIGTDQMGPKRFGSRGRSPSASATSRRTKARRWRSTPGTEAGRPRRSRPTRVIVYFKNVVQAFKARFKQLGGKIVAKETYQSPRRQQRSERCQPLQRRKGRRDRHVDRGRVRSSCRRFSPVSGRSGTTRRS